MSSWIDALASMVAGNPAEAWTVAFLAAVLEAVAVLGTVLPGTVVLMAVAGAAALGGQSMVPFLIVAILGAIMGDGVSYWAGRHFHDHLRSIWPFARRPDLLARAERFFQRYGMASVALCRFIPVLRSNVPLCAGMAFMPPRSFFMANVLSALVWAPVHIYPAQLAAISIGRLQEGDWSGALLCGGLLLLCVVIGWAVHRWSTAHRS